MKVLFVLPPFDMSASYGSSNKMKRGFLPSLGIGHIAAMCERNGHEVGLIDAQVTGMDPYDTVTKILDQDPDVVGISMMSVYAHAGYAVAHELKKRAPKVFILMGGPHATASYKNIMADCDSVDAVIPGEGEIPVGDIVQALANKDDWRQVRGIVFRGYDGEVVVNPQAETAKNLDDLPDPTRHIFLPYEYRPLPNQVRQEPATTAISSRGCSWGKCTFCFQGGEYSPRYRRHTPRRMVEQLIPLVREHGYKEILFWDDTFAVNPRWVESFCDELEREKLNITWSCYGHMRSVKPDMLKRMGQAGCFNIYYGFESGVQEILDMVKKGTSQEQMREAVKWARDAGIEIRGSFILGFPTESPEQTLQTIKFACELNAEWMMFFPFHVLPGTPIEALAHQDGRIIATQKTVYFPEYVSSKYQDAEQLHKMVKQAYFQYYMRPRYWGLVAKNLIQRPYMFKYYYDAAMYWLELTRGGLKMQDVQPEDEVVVNKPAETALTRQ